MFGFGPRKTTAPHPAGGTAGVALTATAATAVAAPPGSARPRAVPLSATGDELPLVARLDAKPVEIGAAGLLRRSPHLVCANYLPQLGTPRVWQAGRGVVTPEDAVLATFAAIRAKLPGAAAVGLALPSYLTAAQVKSALRLAADAGLTVAGSAATAVAIAAHRAAAVLADERPNGDLDPDGGRPDWVVPIRPPEPGCAAVVVVDCDDSALTATVVAVEPGRVRVAGPAAWPHLALKLWKDRLADGLADKCVRLCRRDPRDSAAVDQLLYDQLDAAMDRARDGQPGALTVRSEHWFQDLTPTPADLAGYCARLAAEAAAAVAAVTRAADLPAPPRAVWLTHAAARLPGLTGLLHRTSPEATTVAALPPFAAAEAVAALVPQWLAGDLPAGHAADGLALPAAAPASAERGWRAEQRS